MKKKLYTKIINNNCHQCPECHHATGQGYYYCRKNVSLGAEAYNDDFIPIPQNCPLKDVEEKA